MSAIYRPLTNDEKTYLKSYSSASRYRELLWQFVSIVFTMSFICFILLFGLWRLLALLGGIDNAAEYINYFIIFSVGVSGILAGYELRREIIFMRRSKENGMLKSVREDLKDGIAAVETHDVVGAIEIKEYEDEGTGFFLILKDGRVLCVIGQDLYAFAHDAEPQPDEGIQDERHLFPQTKIEYVYAPKSKIRLDVKGVGEPLRPRSFVKSHKKLFSKTDYYGPESDSFYEGPIEKLLEKFGYVEESLEK